VHAEGGRITTSPGVTDAEIELAVARRPAGIDAHLLELRIHVRVVDDLADEVELALGNFRRVSYA
jgi:hypothetical protein